MGKLTSRTQISDGDVSLDDLVHLVQDPAGTPVSHKATLEQLRAVFPLVNGYTGGQTLTGGTDASDGLRIASTTNATKGIITIGDSSNGLFVDEANNSASLNQAIDSTATFAVSGDLTAAQRVRQTGTGAIKTVQELLDSSGNASTKYGQVITLSNGLGEKRGELITVNMSSGLGGYGSHITVTSSALANSNGQEIYVSGSNSADNRGLVVDVQNSGTGDAYVMQLSDGFDNTGKMPYVINSSGDVEFTDGMTYVAASNTLTISDGTSTQILDEWSNKISSELFSTYEAETYTNASVNAGGSFVGVRYRGTKAAPLAVQNGDHLLGLKAYASSGATDSLVAGMNFLATETHSGSAKGTEFYIYTTKQGTTGATNSLSIDSAGDITLGNYKFDGDQTVGASEDDYVLTYDHLTGLITLEAVSGGASFGTAWEIPHMNSAGTDFLYSGALEFLGGTTLRQDGSYIECFTGSNNSRLSSNGNVTFKNGTDQLYIWKQAGVCYTFETQTSTPVGFGSNGVATLVCQTNGNIDIGQGNYTGTEGARLSVKGSGSTDATTGFKYVNSAGTTIFEAKDGGTVEVNGSSLGNVSNTGTPVNDQLAVWTDANTVEGTSNLIYQSNAFQVKSGSDFCYMYNYGEFRAGQNSSYIQIQGNFANQAWSRVGTNTGDSLRLQSGSQAPIYLDTSGNVSVGASKAVGTTLGSRFEITGSGATSATSGLIVRDSAAATNFEVQDDGVSIFKSFTVATLPTAVAGGYIYVSDETGGATMAFSDGTNWRRVQDRAIVS